MRVSHVQSSNPQRTKLKRLKSHSAAANLNPPQPRPPGTRPRRPLTYYEHRLRGPDAKERAALPAVPFIASPESDRGRPASSRLLDVGEKGRGRFLRRESGSARARGGSFLSGAGSGAWCARRQPVVRSRSPRCAPASRGDPSLPSLALRGAGVAPEFKLTAAVGRRDSRLLLAKSAQNRSAGSRPGVALSLAAPGGLSLWSSREVGWLVGRRRAGVDAQRAPHAG